MLIAYEKLPKLFDNGSINVNDESDKLYKPFLEPNVISEIRGKKARVDNVQLLDGEAKLVKVPCARLLVLSIATVYDPQPVPFP